MVPFKPNIFLFESIQQILTERICFTFSVTINWRMSAVKNIKANDFERGTPARVFAWLILLCISFACLPTFAHQTSKSSELVFCPIQKLWVQKYVPPVKIRQALDEICASDRQKGQFFFEMSKKLPPLRFVHDSDQTKKLFFNYLEKGKQALAEISPTQNIPEPQLAKIAATQKSTGGSYETDFGKIKTEIFVLAQRPRPPTVQKTVSFETVSFIKLETISRRLQPRAPPVSL